MKYVIDDWYFSTKVPDAFTAPELGQPVISGTITYENGSVQRGGINLSRIIGRKGDVLFSMGQNEYQINKPNVGYEVHFPDSKNRILSRFKELS